MEALKKLENNYKMVIWGISSSNSSQAEQKEQLNVGKPVPMVMEIIGTPSINRWRDRKRKQIVIKEWEIK